jgi:hypothetical protein
MWTPIVLVLRGFGLTVVISPAVKGLQLRKAYLEAYLDCYVLAAASNKTIQSKTIQSTWV